VKQLICLVTAAGLSLSGMNTRAQDAGALLDLLVKKKIISDQEAEEVRCHQRRRVAWPGAALNWHSRRPVDKKERRVSRRALFLPSCR
jgi:hypothetical protein